MRRSSASYIVMLLLVFAVATPFIFTAPAEQTTNSKNPLITYGQETKIASVYSGDPSVTHSPTNVIPGTGYQTWYNMLNIYALDSAYAYAYATSTTTYSNTLSIEEFSFSLAVGTVISGIRVDIYTLASHNTANNYVTDYVVRLLDNGVPVGTNLAYTSIHYPSTGKQLSIYGSNGYMWGAGTNYWTPTKVNLSTFGVYYQAYIVAPSATVYVDVDYVAVTIFYYQCLWPAASGSPNSAGASPFTWQDTWQGVPYPQLGYVGCVGQQIATNNGANIYGLVWADTSGNLRVSIRTYTPATPYANLTIWASGAWGNQQGVSVSQMIYANGYDWFVIASRQATAVGIQFAIVRVTEPPESSATNPTVMVIGGPYIASYVAGSQFYSNLNVYLVPIGSGGQVFASYSYGYTDQSGRFGVENVRLNNIWSGTPATSVNDQPISWDQPVYTSFAYASSNSKLYGMYGMVYFQTGATGKAAALYDYSTWTSPSLVTTTAKYPSGPMIFLYDGEFNTLASSFPTQDALQDIWTYHIGGAINEYFPANPVGSSVYDWHDLAGSTNGHGIWVIIGLWSDNHIRFKYTLDMVSWSSWVVAPDSASGYFAQKISLPHDMQPSGYGAGQQGFSSLVQIENSDRVEVKNFQYVPNSMTITGVLPIVAISVNYRTSVIAANAITTLSGTQTIREEQISYITADPPIVLIAYAVMLVLTCTGMAIVFQRSLLAMMLGLTLGVSIASALWLIPIYSIIVVLVGVVLMLIFGRRGGGE